MFEPSHSMIQIYPIPSSSSVKTIQSLPPTREREWKGKASIAFDFPPLVGVSHLFKGSSERMEEGYTSQVVM
jgi:hypothetical protein